MIENQNRRVIYLVFLALCAQALLSTAVYGASTIAFRKEPYTHDKSYVVSGYRMKDNGFEIYVSESKRKTYWHIQVIGDDTIEVPDANCVIRFKAKSNKEFNLYSRLGEESVHDGNSYVDHSWQIIGDGLYHEYRLDFRGKKDIANWLYFQLGKAPSGTRFDLSDLFVESIK